MMTVTYILLALFSFVNYVQGYVRCGFYDCYGSAYCCEHNRLECCYYVWGLWWFWLIWVLFFTLFVACGFWCRRRYYSRTTEYVVVRPTQPVYGTVTATQTYATPAAPGYCAQQKPPDYAAAAQKPPAYSPA